MNARDDDSQSNDKKLSTAQITTFLHENNKNNDQEAKSSASLNDLRKQEKFVLTKSYRPAKLPTKAEIEAEYGESYREAVRTGRIRTDGHNLRLDEERQMYFYLPKNHPEYREHPEPAAENNSDFSKYCTII